MKTVWKFPLTHVHQQTITVPSDHRFLHAAYQRETLCVWFEVDDTSPDQELTIEVVGTGFSLPDVGEWLATVMSPSHQWVWHLYEVPS